MEKLLVTGGCGFIGSHFIDYYLENHPDSQIINIDLLTYAAHPDTSKYLESKWLNRYTHIKLDISDKKLSDILIKDSPKAIINFAAESHVDRSILDETAFIKTNIIGVSNILKCLRKLPKIRFIQISTDEVYGALQPNQQPINEEYKLSPNSPYAASKASADLLTLAFFRTFNLDTIITRCSNNFGPFQFPEKLISLAITNALENKKVPVYGDGKQIRDWIFVTDHCRAIDFVLKNGKAGEVYNISAMEEKPNIEVIYMILEILKKPKSLIEFVGDRPAHDRRYALDSSKIQKELGWKPERSFFDALSETIAWYSSNIEWWEKVKDDKFFEYYKANYDNKFKEVNKCGE